MASIVANVVATIVALLLLHCFFLSLFQVKAATGEEVSAEQLGGADLHCR